MPNPSRREVFAAACGLALLPRVAARAVAPAPDVPFDGIADSRLAPFDQAMLAHMRPRRTPGGALAVVKDGRLVYARGYGYADREREKAAGPQSLFRLASISKTLTAAAILSLTQPPHHLDLDAKVFALLGVVPVVAPGGAIDPRLHQITVRHLLHHTGGWDSGRSGDPMFDPFAIAKATGTEPPASADAIIRYVAGRPLDFDPGSRYCYSNFGYCVLGRVIERVAAKSYEAFVKEAIVGPMQCGARMRIGGSLAADRAKGEVCYYQPEEGLATPVLPVPGQKQVPWADGGFYMRAMDSHGGWIASALDLARFAAGMDRLGNGAEAPRRIGACAPVLGQEAVRTLYEPPAAPASRKADGKLDDWWYACGWCVRPTGAGRANYWHSGSLPGTSTLLVRRSDGLSWVALFNHRSADKAHPDGDIDSALHRAADAVKEWPDHDLFPTYHYPVSGEARTPGGR